jgi:hypothetical protein
MSEGGADHSVGFGVRLVGDGQARAAIGASSSQIFPSGRMPGGSFADCLLDGLVGAVAPGPGQADSLNGSCGGTAQKGKISLISRARWRNHNVADASARGFLVSDDDGAIAARPRRSRQTRRRPASLAMLAFTNCMNSASWPGLERDERRRPRVLKNTRAWMVMPKWAWALPMMPRRMLASSGEGLSRSLPWRVRVVISTTECSGMKRRGRGEQAWRDSQQVTDPVRADLRHDQGHLVPSPHVVAFSCKARAVSSRWLGGACARMPGTWWITFCRMCLFDSSC